MVEQKTNLSNKVVESIINTMLNEIINTIKNNEAINLQKFGTFKPRVVRNKEIYIPGTNIKVNNKYNKKIIFTPSKILKDKLNDL